MLSFLYFHNVRDSRKKFGVDDLRQRHAGRQSKVDIAQPHLGIGYILSLQSRIAPQRPTGDDVDLVITEIFLRFDPVAVLREEISDHIVEEEDQLVLIREEALSFLLDGV